MKTIRTSSAPHDPMLDIQQELDGVAWTPDTLDRIAQILIRSGYRVRDLDDRDLPIAGDSTTNAPYEAAARAKGWTRGGDGGGIIYNTKQYDSWKEAVSWAGTDGPNNNGPVYDSWEECCEGEAIDVAA